MLGRSHLTIGAAVGALAADQLAGTTTGEAMLWAVVGAAAGLAPDLDHHGSTLGRLLPRWWHRRTPGHRGMTHSLVWVAALGLAVGVLGWLLDASGRGAVTLALVTTVGALSHLAADAVTHQGVPWLWPWRRERYSLPPGWSIRTGGIGERVIVALVVTAALLLA